MAVGPVNQALLESNFQNTGEIYLDTKTEGAMQVIVDQVNENAGIFGAGGSDLIYSDTIPGITGNTVYDQIAFIEGQIQSAIGGIVPPDTVTNAMLQTDSVNTRVLAPNSVTTNEIVDGTILIGDVTASLQTALVGAILYTYRNVKGGF